jgi:cytoplasmic iron level regulating protein YaaA (DUF328/UPF0246 family)
MLIVLSPAKTLDYATPSHTEVHTMPDFIDRSAALIRTLKKHSVTQLRDLMTISEPLAQLNATRYASWSKQTSQANAKQAVLAFNGDVYEGLDAASLSQAHLDYLQNRLRILSGLYGTLRPLDLMQPYRLEMGTRLETSKGRDLYAFWGNTVTDALTTVARESDAAALVNLASEEYFKVVQPMRLPVPVITPVFQDWKNGQYKIISFHAKRARGLMTRYAALNRITAATDLQNFDSEGYAFAPEESNATRWIFRRHIE